MIYLLPILAYLVGSVSSAILVARALGLEDPRNVGSKNPGATNILRYGGRLAAVLTLLGDVLKGIVPVTLAHLLTHSPGILAATALAAFIGHLYPLFFGFKGGKGVATALGVWTAINPWIGLLLILTWAVTAAITRYSSLSGLVAAALAPIYVAWLMPSWAYVSVMFIISGLLFYRHWPNIQRLRAGEEAKIGS